MTARGELLDRGESPRPEIMTIVRLDGEDVSVEMASTTVTWQGQAARQVEIWELDTDVSLIQELLSSVDADDSDPVVVTDAELRVQRLNAAAEELYGWRSEAIGRPSSEVSRGSGTT